MAYFSLNVAGTGGPEVRLSSEVLMRRLDTSLVDSPRRFFTLSMPRETTLRRVQ